GLHRCVAMTLGNLTESDARTYVCGSPEPSSGAAAAAEAGAARWLGLLPALDPLPGFTLPEHVWPMLYNVCGGNLGALRCVASAAVVAYTVRAGATDECWDEALLAERARAAAVVDRGFRPNTLPARGGHRAAWEPRQWVATLQAIAGADRHAVPVPELRALLGAGNIEAGAAALESLLRFNMVGYRQRSVLASDLPPEVYGRAGTTPVITARDAAVLECILGNQWAEQAMDVAIQTVEDEINSLEAGRQGWRLPELRRTLERLRKEKRQALLLRSQGQL
ncbi:hypothetical protein TSOC_008350, partial [Tetrabaena socialis]